MTNYKTTSLIVIAAVFIIGAGYFLLRPTNSPTQDGSQTVDLQMPDSQNGGFGTHTVTVPSATSQNGSSPAHTDTIAIQTNSRVVMRVNDFINDPETATDPRYPGHYYLVGGVDPPLGAPYGIVYISSDQSFTISLFKEPIAEVRKTAEQELLKKLGITEYQACALRYWVGVPSGINDFYSNQNLGFSFCPGATVIPE